jgi:hypothetical protein
VAAFENNLDLVRILLDAGADPDIKDKVKKETLAMRGISPMLCCVCISLESRP